ncbi:Exostosin-like, partial [Thalictrum thalictroides]
EELAIKDGIPEFMKKSIILQTFGVNFRHVCQAENNVIIPPYLSPIPIHNVVSPANGKRDIFVFFRGKMEVHPKNISGQFYSRKVRSTIWHKFSRNRKFYLKRERYDGYQSEIRRSVFCLCPLGWAPWSPRIVESVALGCVPVIIADGIKLPYSETIQWSKISITVAEKDVSKLGKILKHVASTNLTTIQKNLWDPFNRRALLYNENEIKEGDATWQIISSLSHYQEKLLLLHK